ncbi:MAG: BatA and WFA domain-containing protein [Gammaproteobacteria bacterium]|nr:BatA and WFA domain-containing protein [Gammaproteobacteria bacterium]
MSLVAPLFLLGVFAIALPLWLHRLQTQSSDRKPFSSAMLLETAKQRIHVKKKLKYLLLLAARIALLVLLAVSFAKPFLRVPPSVVTATEAGTHVLLVDTSASMGRTGVFDQAISEARRTIDNAPADALIQVLAAAGDLQVIGALTNDRGEARSSLTALSATALRLDYGEVMSAVERYVAALPQPVSLHFVSDFQASGMPVRFSDVIPGGVASLTPHVVGTGDPFNWSIDYLRETAEGLDAGLNGAGDRERIADVELLVNDVVVASQGLSQTGPQVLNFEVPAWEEGENRVQLRINTDDDFAADNRWHHVVDKAPPAPIPLITLNPGGLPVIYLSAALESSGSYQVDPLIAGNFDLRVLSRYRWAVIDEIGLVNAELEAALIDFIASGGNLLAFAGDRAAGLETLPVTGHRHAETAIRPQSSDFLSVGQIDTRHPILSATEGWQSVNVTRNLPLEVQDGDEVLIRLENNEPFLIERRMGQGRLLLMPATLDNQWNDLPVRPVFVSFIIETARYLSGISEIQKTYTTGASLPLARAGNTSGQVIDPDGNTVLSLADTTRDQQIKLNKPGIYEVYTPQGLSLVAANIDPRESDLRKVTQEVLDNWQEATGGTAVTAGARYTAEQENTVELWHWLLMVLALIVIGESILGNMHLSPRRMERA